MVNFVRSDGGGFLTGSMIAMLVLCAIFFLAGSFNSGQHGLATEHRLASVLSRRVVAL